MCYGGITKGVVGIAAAMLRLAAAHGIEDVVRAELEQSQPVLFPLLERSLAPMEPKAYRWVAEMDEIAAFAHEETATAAMYRGLARLYERIAEERGTQIAASSSPNASASPDANSAPTHAQTTASRQSS
jgi:hypothetical protein